MVRCSISGASVLAPGCFFAGLTSEDSQIPSIPSPHCEVNSLAGGCPNLHTPKTGVVPPFPEGAENFVTMFCLECDEYTCKICVK